MAVILRRCWHHLESRPRKKNAEVLLQREMCLCFLRSRLDFWWKDGQTRNSVKIVSSGGSAYSARLKCLFTEFCGSTDLPF